jgi:hypothetical protein
MKTRAIVISIFLGLLLLAATAPVQAQQPFRVKVPFNFVAGQVSLPAGDYMVQPASDGSPALILHRLDGDRNASAIVMTNSAEASTWKSNSSLVFRVYGEGYFLSQVWTIGNTSGRQLRTSPIEKQLAKNETPHDIILVATLQ